MKKSLLITLLAVLLFLMGCEETEITLNPDGSGKLVYRTTLFDMIDTDLSGNELEASLKQSIRSNILTDFKGVDAWKDVTYNVNEMGDLSFEGTAYFKDINQLENGSIMGLYDNFVFTTQDGQASLSFSYEEIASSESLTGLAPEAILEQIEGAYEMQRNFLEKASDLQTSLVLNLPGEVTSANAFSRDEPISLTLTSEAWKTTLDVMMQDEAFLLEQANAKLNPLDTTPVAYFQEQLFNGMPSISFEASAASFDYDAEVSSEVRAASDSLLASLGLETPDLNTYLAKVEPLLTKNDMPFEFGEGSAPVAGVQIQSSEEHGEYGNIPVNFMIQLVDNSGNEHDYVFNIFFKWFEDEWDDSTGWRCASYEGGGIDNVLPDFTGWFNFALTELGIDSYYHC